VLAPEQEPAPALPAEYSNLTVRPAYDVEGGDHRIEFRLHGHLVATSRATSTGVLRVTGEVPTAVESWVRHVHRRISEGLATLPVDQRARACGDSALSLALVRFATGTGDAEAIHASIGSAYVLPVRLEGVLLDDIRSFLASAVRAGRAFRGPKAAWAAKRRAVLSDLRSTPAPRVNASDLHRLILDSTPVTADPGAHELRDSILMRLAAAHDAARRFHDPFGHKRHVLDVPHWSPTSLDRSARDV